MNYLHKIKNREEIEKIMTEDEIKKIKSELKREILNELTRKDFVKDNTWKTIKKEFLFMAIGLFLVMVIGITVIIGEVTKIEQAEQLVSDGYISMEKYYGRVEKKIETCQKYANFLTALSDEDMLIAGDICGNMETEEEAIAQYLTEMEKLTKDISELSLTDRLMTYSSVN